MLLFNFLILNVRFVFYCLYFILLFSGMFLYTVLYYMYDRRPLSMLMLSCSNINVWGYIHSQYHASRSYEIRKMYDI